jgi:hypothetical protein
MKELSDADKKLNKDKVSSDGLLSKIIKRAILAERLPLTRSLIRLADAPIEYRLKLAKITTSALKSELDADVSSIHCDGASVEIETDIRGSDMAVTSAISDILSGLSDVFKDVCGIKVSFEVIPHEISRLDLVNLDTLEDSFRKLAFNQWSKNASS